MELKIFVLNAYSEANTVVEQIKKWAVHTKWNGEIILDKCIHKPDVFAQMLGYSEYKKLFHGYGIIIFNAKESAYAKLIKDLSVEATSTFFLYDSRLSINEEDVQTGFPVQDWTTDLTDRLNEIKGDLPLICKKTKNILTFKNMRENYSVDKDWVVVEELNFSQSSVSESDDLPIGEIEESYKYEEKEYIPPEEEKTWQAQVAVEYEHKMNTPKSIEVAPVQVTEQEPIKETVREETSTNEEQTITFAKKDEIPFERSREVQKHVFSHNRVSNKSIAIWSPIQRMGVTTLSINYACFLAENRLFVGVLEGLRPHNTNILKHIVKRYSAMPRNWESYATMTHKGVTNEKVANWHYKDALFLPLDDSDSELNWTYGTLATYIRNSQAMDITLIDIPSGYLEDYSIETIRLVDELWIVIDDTYQEIVSWKSYIEEIQKLCKVSVKLIFNKQYPFSQAERLSKLLGYPIIATIPAMHELVMKNYYENEALLYKEDARTLLYPSFEKLTKELLGEDFVFLSNLDLAKKRLPGASTHNWRKFTARMKAWWHIDR